MNNTKDPRISIVIPVRNAERTLDRTMEYITKVDYPENLLEIIIADGGSTDGTVEAIHRWQSRHDFIRFVSVPNCSSPGHARNEALKLVKGEYVLFTDGDCAPNADWAREILKPFLADPQIGAVGGEVLTLRTEPDNHTESYCEQVRFLSVSGRCGLNADGYYPGLSEKAPHEVNGGDHSPFFATANVAFRKEAIDAAGGEFWPEPTGEDVDFSLRILGSGYRLYFAKSAVVRHMHRVSLQSYLRQWYGYGYGHPLLIEKHAARELEFVIQTPKPVFLRVGSPFKGIVHIGAFQLMHLFAASAILAGIRFSLAPHTWPAFVLTGGLALIAAMAYFSPCLDLKPKRKFLTWCKLRYLTNLAFTRGALAGSRRFGALCLEPSW